MHVAHHTRIAAAVASATLLLIALAGPVAAHASLVSSSPAEGSGDSISQLTEVTLTFDDDLDAAKSQFIVANEGGGTVATGHVTADPKVMQVTGLHLNWGAHEARWTAVATDGDLTRGVVHFSVIQDGAVAPAAMDSSNSITVIIAVVAGLAVIAVAASILMRRGRRS